MIEIQVFELSLGTLESTEYLNTVTLTITTKLEQLYLQLSTSLYKQVLVNLHEKVMPHMTSPLLLADFLTESYDIGGAISLLALNGLFVLINSYNL